jgi:3-deoxy-manno-octulosonate cytidylyltransferase (CMP-KDO synthetase)
LRLIAQIDDVGQGEAVKAAQDVVVIPARYGSTRFPGKPLKMITGWSMIHRVWCLAKAAPGVASVYVAIDDDRIASHVRGFGGEAIMTPPECHDSTERVFRAAEALARPPAIVVNLQGDAVLIPPWVIGAMIGVMPSDPSVEIATPAVRVDRRSYEALRAAKQAGEVGGTTVAFDRCHNALYFSKSLIPFMRSNVDTGAALPIYRHIGLYAYRFETLYRYVALEPGPLERAEKLEQLRALENGIPIRVVEVEYPFRCQVICHGDQSLGMSFGLRYCPLSQGISIQNLQAD